MQTVRIGYILDALDTSNASNWHWTTLLSIADSRPSFYSHWNAPGMVMAVGNVGEFLDPAADATCTWLSRDGGLTWQVISTCLAIHLPGPCLALDLPSTCPAPALPWPVSFASPASLSQ